jgi:hypothetical protein
MKLSHELANEMFTAFSIDEKRIIIAMMAQLNGAETKHPKWPQDILHSLAILTEAAGEVAKDTLQYVYEKGPYYDIHNELLQTGAMAIRMYKNLPKKKLFDEEKDTEPKYQKK